MVNNRKTSNTWSISQDFRKEVDAINHIISRRFQDRISHIILKLNMQSDEKSEKTSKNDYNDLKKDLERFIVEFRGTNHHLHPENPSMQSKKEIKRVFQMLYTYCIELSYEKDKTVVTENISYIMNLLYNNTKDLNTFDLMRRQGLYQEEKHVVTLDWRQWIEIQNMWEKIDFEGKIRIWRSWNQFEVFYVKS